MERKVIDGVNWIYSDGKLTGCQVADRRETLQIPDGIVEINVTIAFMGCAHIKNIIIPKSVEIIKSRSFFGLESLQQIYIENPQIIFELNSLYYLKKLELLVIGNKKVNAVTVCVESRSGGSNLSLEKYIGRDVTYVADREIEVIGNNAFSYNKTLEYVEISNNIFMIGFCAFEGCEALRDIKMSEKLNGIAFRAFKDCVNIRELTVPRTVISIAREAFKGWRKDQLIRVPYRFKKPKFLQKWRKGCKAQIMYY